MRKAYLHKSKTNRSEGRLFITTSPKPTTTLIKAETFWLEDQSSYDQALSVIRWHCECYGYQLIEETCQTS